MIEDLLWVEKYRPRKVDKCCLPSRIKKAFLPQLEKGVLNNMTLTGTAGCGKTTVARAICDELDIEYMFINASESGNIDTIRNQVRQYGSSMSFNGKKRAVILDEGDYLTPLAQASLRGMIEEFSSNCRFIITANFSNKLIEPLISRCPLVDFTLNKNSDEVVEVLVQAESFIREILEKECIAPIKPEEETVFSSFLVTHMPDLRTILNILQRSCSSGSICWEDVFNSKDLCDVDGLVEILKTNNFDSLRDWVSANAYRDTPSIRRNLYTKLRDVITPISIPAVIMSLNKYDFQEAFCVDKEINTMAMLLEIVSNVEFKK